MLEHGLGVCVCDQEGDVVALDWFPAQYNEILRSLHHESGELVCEDTLNLVCLLNLDTEPDRVDGRLDEDAFVLVS